MCSSDDILNPDVTIEKQNLTPHGMNIYFSLLIGSTIHLMCADWLACSLDTI